jgi:hypothetical protein
VIGCDNIYEHRCADCTKKICGEHSFESGGWWFCPKCNPVS